MFQHNIAYIVNSFVLSSITVMTNILPEIIKTPYKEMLRTINMYLFRNESIEKITRKRSFTLHKK